MGDLNYAERALAKQIKELGLNMEQIQKSLTNEYSKSVYAEDKTEIEEKIKKHQSFLGEMFDKISDIKDEIASSIVTTGKLLHSSDKEEVYKDKAIKSIIKDFKVVLKEEDYDPVAIVNYLCNEKIVSTSDSLSLAETNLILAKQLKNTSINAAKIAMLQNSHNALVIHKNNILSTDFATAYAKRHNLHIDAKNLITSLEKLEEFNKAKKDNERLIYETCRIAVADINMKNINDSLNSIKSLSAKKPHSLEFDDFHMSTEEFNYIPNPKDSKAEIFVEYATFYLELELPDPQNKLKSQLDINICKTQNKFFENIETKENLSSSYNEKRRPKSKFLKSSL